MQWQAHHAVKVTIDALDEGAARSLDTIGSSFVAARGKLIMIHRIFVPIWLTEDPLNLRSS